MPNKYGLRPFHGFIAVGLILLLGLGLNVSNSRKLAAAQAKDRHNKAVAAAQKAEQDRLQSLEAKLTAQYEKFVKDTNETIQEITRLEAATETGINIFRYSELLSNVNYKVRIYREQYGGTVESRFPVYNSIINAMSA